MANAAFWDEGGITSSDGELAAATYICKAHAFLYATYMYNI